MEEPNDDGGITVVSIRAAECDCAGADFGDGRRAAGVLDDARESAAAIVVADGEHVGASATSIIHGAGAGKAIDRNAAPV